MKKVMVIDDETIIRKGLSQILRLNGFIALEAASGIQAVEIFKAEHPDIVLLDLKMPDMNGLEVMKRLKAEDARTLIIFLTAHGDIPTAVEAIKQGAYDFIAKPPDVDMLLLVLQRAAEKIELESNIERLNTAVVLSLENIMGKSLAIKGLVEQVRRVASSDFTVIIEGETGTGKTSIAETIHNFSKRAKGPFVKVDLGTLPETIVESELFGYERGAFTGADKSKKGFFETANRGTLFLDELQNISPHIQGKLLSAIEDKRVFPLGSVKPVVADIRIIVATNKDLKKSIERGSFREDLFYRLADFTMTLPPLRERPEDIPFLSGRFIEEVASEMGKNITGASEEAMRILMGHAWPGNIRELRNVIRRAVLLMEDGPIMPEHIRFLSSDRPDNSDLAQKDTASLSLRDISKEAEKKAIKKTLAIAGGNKTKAAALLQITYRSLLMKTKEYGIA